MGAITMADDCRVERSSGPVPSATHHHRTAEGFARGAGEDPTSPAPVRRELQAHQQAASAADTPVISIITPRRHHSNNDAPTCRASANFSGESTKLFVFQALLESLDANYRRDF